MTTHIRLMEPNDAVEWDAYVNSHTHGSFFHLSSWARVVEYATPHKCPYLMAETNGEIVGVLPLTLRNSLLFGRAAVCGYFTVQGGALTNDQQTEKLLYDHAWRLTQDFGATSLEVRQIEAASPTGGDWQQKTGASAIFRKHMADTTDERLLSIPRKQRAVVRKSLKQGLAIKSGPEQLKSVYKMYAQSVHRHGTPVFSFRLFEALLNYFPNQIDLSLCLDKDGDPTAGLMSFVFKNEILPYYVGGTVGSRRNHAHEFLYFQLMERSYENGARVFDFGRSRVGTGPFKYKQHWGFEPTPVVTSYRLAPGREMPDLTPGRGKFAVASKIWRQMPLALANLIGPKIAQDLG